MSALNLPPNANTEHPIVFYDGICGLCDKSVQFIIKHDKKKVFRYATLQSELAKKVIGEKVSVDSFVLFQDGKLYYQSTAALKVIKQLGGFLQTAYIFILVPPFIRNAVYDWVAANRYKWFGKYDTCVVPTMEQRKLFII
jgi:predicted DCC family thiol-disulfide oxidoreductase YuxK